jgi:hypothetical protein
LPRLLIFFQSTNKSPANTGLFIARLNRHCKILTSNDDASSGGASDGGDASPNAGDASGGGANPSAGGASPNAFGPSALLPV